MASAPPACDVPQAPLEKLLPAGLLAKQGPPLPEVGELDLVRHYVRLSQKNMSVDSNFYPLGSCTMKYNPKVNEKVASLPGFAKIHPLQDASTVQGMLRLLGALERELSEITGMDAVSLQPAAGAQGELTGLMMIRAFLADRGQRQRRVVLIPDSAHGTNPASCTLCDLEAREVKSDSRGLVDMGDLDRKLTGDVAALMLTNPNTLGLFEENIAEIARRVHERGALLYMDGANLNAILGVTRPGDFGVDVLHINVHKTFSTPHGGGGPGAGPVAMKAPLAPYRPVPVVREENGRFFLDEGLPKSIGKVKSFWGHAGIFVRAYAYLRAYGAENLRKVAEMAVLNANYLLARLRSHYHVPYDRPCMHEFVLTNMKQKKHGIRTLDIAKRLLDYGFHPPTIYFPLVVSEAIMIEPTESESLETLDRFAEAMIRIAEECQKDPELVRQAPHHRPVRRLDEVRAAREPILRWQRQPR